MPNGREIIWGLFTLAVVQGQGDNPTDYVFAIDTPWGQKATFIASRHALNFWWNSGGEVGVPSRHEHVTAVTLHFSEWPPRITWFSEWINFDS
jgi:hypothetical protein